MDHHGVLGAGHGCPQVLVRTFFFFFSFCFSLSPFRREIAENRLKVDHLSSRSEKKKSKNPKVGHLEFSFHLSSRRGLVVRALFRGPHGRRPHAATPLTHPAHVRPRAPPPARPVLAFDFRQKPNHLAACIKFTGNCGPNFDSLC